MMVVLGNTLTGTLHVTVDKINKDVDNYCWGNNPLTTHHNVLEVWLLNFVHSELQHSHCTECCKRVEVEL